MKIRWKLILYIITVLVFIASIIWFFYQPGFEPLITLLLSFSGLIVETNNFFSIRKNEKKKGDIELFDSNCGNKGIDLQNMRLGISAAFGSYFVSLLEREDSYLTLENQIQCLSTIGTNGLPPIQQIYWQLQNPKGAKIFIIAADGGMGKSTLASKLVRCLYEQGSVDRIWGDSAKTEMIDPITGDIQSQDPAFDTYSEFCKKLCNQLGTQYENNELAIKDIIRRSVDKHAVIVVDNLETINQRDQIIQALLKITNRDIRAIVTTRQIENYFPNENRILLVNMNPIAEVETASYFINWHISQYRYNHPALERVREDTQNERKMKLLVEKSGGNPLLMQLLVGDIARSNFSWDAIQSLPTLFGKELLNYLYQERWKELERLGDVGKLSQQILVWINQEQTGGKIVRDKTLIQWAVVRQKDLLLADALQLLFERFLLLHSHNEKGHYSIFPSLSDFLKLQHERVV